MLSSCPKYEQSSRKSTIAYPFHLSLIYLYMYVHVQACPPVAAESIPFLSYGILELLPRTMPLLWH